MRPFPVPVSAMWLLAAAVISGNLLRLGAAQQAGGGALTAVRFWSLGEVTRVAVETDREVQYRWERIENPDRVFLTLPDLLPEVSARFPQLDGRWKVDGE